MAERHVRAVHAHSKSTKKGRVREVIKEIALDIGRNDEPAYPSVRSLAQRIDGSVNTVRNAIKWGIDNGEIEIVKEEGQRRYFALLLPVLPRKSTDTVFDTVQNTVSKNQHKNGVTDTVSTSGSDTVLLERLIRLEETVSNLATTVSKLAETVSVTVSKNLLTVSKNDETVSVGDTEDRSIEDKEEVEEVDLNDDLEDNDNYDPNHKHDGFDHYGEQSDVARALSQVTGFSPFLSPYSAQKFDDAVERLHKAGYTGGQILGGFSGENCYWSVDSFGKTGQMPRIGNVLNEIGRATNWTAPAPDNTPTDDAFIRTLWSDAKQISNGSTPERIKRLIRENSAFKGAVNAMGGESSIQRIQVSQDDFAYARFAKHYRGLCNAN